MKNFSRALLPLALTLAACSTPPAAITVAPAAAVIEPPMNPALIIGSWHCNYEDESVSYKEEASYLSNQRYRIVQTITFHHATRDSTSYSEVGGQWSYDNERLHYTIETSKMQMGNMNNWQDSLYSLPFATGDSESNHILSLTKNVMTLAEKSKTMSPIVCQRKP